MIAAPPTGKRKAATVLVALGSDLSARVLQHFRENDVEELVLEVLTLGSTSSSASDQIIEEFYQRAVNYDRRSPGGIDYARDLLARTLGDSRAHEILSRLTEQGRPRPFDFLRQTDAAQLATFLQDEHPQTIALVLAHLPHALAANVLKALPVETGSEVALRLAAMDRAAPEVIDAVEGALQQRMSGFIIPDSARIGGAEFMAKVLGHADRATEREILSALEQRDVDLATEVRRLLFTFDQLTLLDDRSLQRVLRDVDLRDLSLALRSASSELSERILKNLSTRSADTLREEMSLAGTVRPKQVLEAQQRIVAVVRRLEETEEIIVERGGGDGGG